MIARFVGHEIQETKKGGRRKEVLLKTKIMTLRSGKERSSRLKVSS